MTRRDPQQTFEQRCSLIMAVQDHQHVSQAGEHGRVVGTVRGDALASGPVTRAGCYAGKGFELY